MNLPNSLKTIESWTFDNCENLTSIEIPNSVTTIGEWAFYGCSSLESVTIGTSVRSIDKRAFSIYKKVEFTCLAPIPPDLYFDGNSFNTVFKSYNDLHVYEGLKETYQNAGGEWAKFNIIDDIELVKIEGITLDKEQYRCALGKTGQAFASVTNENASFKAVQWTSSDPSILSIDSRTGEFEGLQLGQVSITASAPGNESVFTSAIVSVEPPILVNSLAFDNTEYIVERGQTISLSPVITPEDADEKTIEWTTSNENIATVEDGVVKGVNGGVATITAKTTDGSNLSASCAIVVDGPLYDYNSYLESSYTGMYSISQVGSRLQKSIEIYIENKGTESITISQVTVKRIDTDEIVATLTDTDATGQLKAGARKEASFTIYEDAPLEDFYYEWSYIYNYRNCLKVSKDYVPTLDVVSVTINVETATMQVEDTKFLTATVHPSIAMDKTVTWTSSAPDIAEVSTTGKVTAKAVGEADITAESHNGMKAVCHIVVEPTLIESISINSPKSEIGVGEKVSFTAVVVPEKATDKTVIWSSSDENVATVSADGVVVGVAIGKAMITAKAADGSIARATVPVTVVQNVELLTFDTKTMILGQGETATIGVTIAPDNARNKALEWTTSDKNIATVKDGVVTALEGGVATITAKTTDGSNLSASCTVVVDAPPYDYNNFLSSACTGQYSRTQFGSIVKMAIGFYIENKGSESINITKVNVRRNSNNALILSSSDASLLGQLKAGQRKELEFTINEDASIWGFHYEWYYTYNGHECIKNSDEPAKKIDVYAITLDEESITMRDGETKTLSTKVYPTFATEKTLTWTSSDTDVATVSAGGKVTATGVGEADIYATAKSGVSAVCHVIVETTPVESIKVVAKKTEIEVDEQVVFTASILPVNATAKTVIWSSSNEDVATVSAKGAVVGIAPGKTTITAEATDGSGMKDSVEVTVVLSNGIEYITLDDDNMKVYDTNGIELSGTKRGVNIIKTTNGTTRKVIKK